MFSSKLVALNLVTTNNPLALVIFLPECSRALPLQLHWVLPACHCVTNDWMLSRCLETSQADTWFQYPNLLIMSMPSNYGPISTAAFVWFSIILESVIYRIIFHHPSTNCYNISSKQWSFLPGRSSISALLSVMHHWLPRTAWPRSYLYCVLQSTKGIWWSLDHHLILQKLLDIQLNPYIWHLIGEQLSEYYTQLMVVEGTCPPILPACCLVTLSVLSWAY